MFPRPASEDARLVRRGFPRRESQVEAEFLDADTEGANFRSSANLQGNQKLAWSRSRPEPYNRSGAVPGVGQPERRAAKRSALVHGFDLSGVT